jgi:type IV pilus assembly protein PilQ
MDLKITKDEPDYSRLVNGQPPLNKREVNTSVQVDSGNTVVLGGTYETSSTTNAGKVPLLGDIPLLGFLFSNSGKIDTKRELLIFVTPKVLQEGLKVD